MTQPDSPRFVPDGCCRAGEAARVAIWAEVEREYAARWAEASWLGRIRLRRQIVREVARRLRVQAPPGAMY